MGKFKFLKTTGEKFNSSIIQKIDRINGHIKELNELVDYFEVYNTKSTPPGSSSESIMDVTLDTYEGKLEPELDTLINGISSINMNDDKPDIDMDALINDISSINMKNTSKGKPKIRVKSETKIKSEVPTVKSVVDSVDDIVYTDGSCTGNGTLRSKGGFGIYIYTSSIDNEISLAKKVELEKFTYNNNTYSFPVTNIRTEGWAIVYVMKIFYYKYLVSSKLSKSNIVKVLNDTPQLNADLLKTKYNKIELIKKPLKTEKTIHIYTDSQFWMDVYMKWMPNWVAKQILLEKKNPDILLYGYYYKTLLECNNIVLDFHHVNSHQKGKNISVHAERNNYVDILAGKAMGLKDLNFTLINT